MKTKSTKYINTLAQYFLHSLLYFSQLYAHVKLRTMRTQKSTSSDKSKI